MSDLRTAYLEQYFDEVSSKEFYRRIFPLGELQEQGASGDMKYNAVAVELLPKGSKRNTKRYTIADDLTMIDELVTHDNFILLSPISYVGKSREAKNARFIYALAIDLDGVSRETHMIDLFHQVEVAEFLPRPTYVVSSGNGLHIYYVFQEPIPCFKNITEQLAKMKRNLTKKLWNGYLTEYSENVQYQSLFQGFRLVGGVTKGGGRVRAFETGQPVSVEYLNQFVQEENRLTEFAYKSSLSKAEAQRKYPDWYHKRIEQKMPKGSWVCKRDLYEWWKGKIKAEIVEGHRYYGVMCLAIYAKKSGIDRAELEKDAFGMVEQLDGLTKDEHNHFTRADVMSALEMYNDNYITFPIESISSLTNVPIQRNKRNGRKQKDHVKRITLLRDNDYPNGEWRNKEGRPKAEPIIRAYMENNPLASKAEVIRGTGLAKNTVYKYYDDIHNVVQRLCNPVV